VVGRQVLAPSQWLCMPGIYLMCMKPVVLSLCLVLLFVVGIASGSLEDCPTCFYAYDSNGLLIEDTNPYAGCPTCVFNYDATGAFINTPNPYAGCPTCVFNYDSTGILITYTNTGCSSCSFLSTVSPAPTVYTFPDGTAIPDDYLCPIHGVNCPDDPRPLEERPGYAALTSTVTQTQPSLTDSPDTSVPVSRIYSRASSQSRSDGLVAILSRVSRLTR
jgi:hypothetical protein